MGGIIDTLPGGVREYKPVPFVGQFGRGTILRGDCLGWMDEMYARMGEYFYVSVSSPPYWGVRDYQIPATIWVSETGETCGNSADSHQWGEPVPGFGSDSYGEEQGVFNRQGSGQQYARHVGRGRFCLRCNCWLGALGLEPSIDLYIWHLVLCYRGVWRLLRRDGTNYINIGDQYAQNGKRATVGEFEKNKKRREEKGYATGAFDGYRGQDRAVGTVGGVLKEKDMTLCPERLIVALQEDGWVVRSRIEWYKPNALPQSVPDRPSPNHEHIWMLTKSTRKTRIIQLSDGDRKTLHLGDDFGPESAPMWDATGLTTNMVRAVLNFTKFEKYFRLASLDPQVWEELLGYEAGTDVTALPVEHRPAIWALRWLRSYVTTEQLLKEFQSLFVALSDANALLVFGRTCHDCFGPDGFPDSPGIFNDGKGTIAIHYAGQVGKIDLVKHRFLVPQLSANPYFYNREAVRSDGLGSVDCREERIQRRIEEAGKSRRTRRLREALYARLERMDVEGQTLFLSDDEMQVYLAELVDQAFAEIEQDDDEVYDENEVVLLDEYGIPVDENYRPIGVPDKEKRPYDSLPTTTEPYVSYLKTVWTIHTQPSPTDHSATFPDELARRCIALSTPDVCCGQCGAAYKPQIVKYQAPKEDLRRVGIGPGGYHGQETKDYDAQMAQKPSETKRNIGRSLVVREIVGWDKNCPCETYERGRAKVLDPFAGVGTSVTVAVLLGRDGHGIEMNGSSADTAEADIAMAELGLRQSRYQQKPKAVKAAGEESKESKEVEA